MPSIWDQVLSETAYDVVRERIVGNLNWIEDNTGKFGAYVMPNLKKDRFLDPGAARDLIDLVLDFDQTAPLNQFIEAYIDICHRYSLKGGEIGLSPYPKKIGRAVEASKYPSMLEQANGQPDSIFERLLRNLENGTLTSYDKAALYSSKMSKFGAWITWDLESSGSDDPFKFACTNCANEIRAALGMIREESLLSLPLLVIEYDGDDPDMLFRPSIADAAENFYFSAQDEPPPRERDWFGLTRPWQDGNESDAESIASSIVPRRPEAVHSSIDFPYSVSCRTYVKVSNRY